MLQSWSVFEIWTARPFFDLISVRMSVTIGFMVESFHYFYYESATSGRRGFANFPQRSPKVESPKDIMMQSWSISEIWAARPCFDLISVSMSVRMSVGMSVRIGFMLESFYYLYCEMATSGGKSQIFPNLRHKSNF